MTLWLLSVIILVMTMVRKSSPAISLRGSQPVNEHGQGHEYLIEAFLFLSFPSGVTDLMLIARMQSLRMSNSDTYFVIKTKDLSPILASNSISIHFNALLRWQAKEMLVSKNEGDRGLPAGEDLRVLA